LKTTPVCPPPNNDYCELVIFCEIDRFDFSSIQDIPVIGSLFPPEFTVPLYQHLGLSLDINFVLTPLSELTDPLFDSFYPKSAFQLVKAALPVFSHSGTLFFILMYLFLKTQFEIPYEKTLLLPVSIYIIFQLYYNTLYALGYALILYSGIFLLAVPPGQKEAPGTYKSHLALTFFMLATVVATAIYVPQTKLPFTLSFIPLLLLAPVAASFSAYGYYLSPSLQYSYPTYLILILSTIMITFLCFIDQMPILYMHARISTFILPLFGTSLKFHSRAFSFPGYIFYPLHFIFCSLTPADPDLAKVFSYLCDHPVLLSLGLQVIHFIPFYQELYIELSMWLFPKEKKEPLPPNLKNYIKMFTKNMYRPLARIFSFRNNVLLHFFFSGSESFKFSPAEDINTVYLLFNFCRHPFFFVQYVLLYGVLRIFSLPERAQKTLQKVNPSPPSVEASLSTKLAQLRNMFSTRVTVHRYLDVAPEDAVHALYALHVTGSKNKAPYPVKVQSHIELFEVLITPPPEQKEMLDKRLKNYGDLMDKVQQDPTPKPPTKRQPPPSPRQLESTSPVAFEVATLLQASEVPPPLLEKLKACTVLLSAAGSVFTGFFVTPHTICTVSHGQTKASEVASTEVTITEGTHYSSDDVMMLFSKEVRTHATLRTSLPQPGDNVFLVTAHPSKVVIHGVVRYSDSHAILSSMHTYPGTSGSAVFDMSGNVVSMHQAANGQLAASLPSASIRKHLTSFLKKRAPSH